MKIAVTGRYGQVASSLIERGALAGHDIVPLARPEIDLARPDTVGDALAAVAPDVIVSAAAYTAVDKAEAEPQLAEAINVLGPAAVAAAASRLNVPVIHLSTDYVFDGALDRPYRECDATGPIGVYGASKLAGEQAVAENCPNNAAILRVAWVYSPFGGNFVKTMLRLGAEREEIAVVADQIGNPTSALDIADGILTVAGNMVGSRDAELRGIFHMTAAGEASWAMLAEAIFAASAALQGPSARVRPIQGIDYPTPAARPMNSRLDSTLIANVHGVTLPEWHGALERVVQRLLAA
ncbi:MULTISPECIES: dTDP-4-dehydrorhamnose reductase [unclassified Novosphingobium]|uniref:dTDP-4-dehydrorhamnose reductase n=1 Tax=unclassified Novosphingobium TaxID=2644732 RepID=UPI0003B36B17|nr:dTDP-4-dehydrorhamnose reductase [Novosphingobium sp. B-7]MBB3356497.1 dTDP-4-dehydrorhamnose reductase [Novosphingobium sp. BK256]MBB3372898.1 dTDP-4-dehydrorhamnose reductase [Novosphingobium sp. BK280]MBB3377266.1 dTDP-4-dehydrorhamnose reductase [Novosphingobium sp. BK258]MBB3419323.1 dTDP-4-dehydrorhamnose reductase [Novosphingobium sp. BK267]MBB3448860.1 dTDP-4-dehydrorhamnose reductase [Novosphingobium sp. BK352]MBB3476183.1 dTDP-4-dehydrorhamnose reductase [Novosphingobium sp. BK36